MSPQVKRSKPSTAAVLRAIAHDDRIAVLKSFKTKGKEPVELSAKMLSVRLDQPLSNVSYHVKALRNAGLLYTHRYEPRRGARENFQRLTPLGTRALDLIDQAEKVSR